MDTAKENSRRGEAGADNERAYLLKYILICVLAVGMGGSSAPWPGLLSLGWDGGGGEWNDKHFVFYLLSLILSCFLHYTSHSCLLFRVLHYISFRIRLSA